MLNIGDKVRVSVSPDYTPHEVNQKTAVVTGEASPVTGYYPVKMEEDIKDYEGEEFLFTWDELTKIEKTAELSVGDHAEIINTALVSGGLRGRVGVVTDVYEGPTTTEVRIEVRNENGREFSQTVFAEHLKKTDAPVTYAEPVEATLVPKLSDLTVGTKVKIVKEGTWGVPHEVGETGTVVDGHGNPPPFGTVWVNIEGYSRPGHGYRHNPEELEIIEAEPEFYVGQPIPVGSDMFDRLPVGTVIDLLNEPEGGFYREKRDSGWTHEGIELRIDGKDLFQEYKVKSLPEAQVEDHQEVLDTAIEDFFKALFEAPRDTEVVADRKDEDPVMEETPENPFPKGSRVIVTEDDAKGAVVRKGDAGEVTSTHYSAYEGVWLYDVVMDDGPWWFFDETVLADEPAAAEPAAETPAQTGAREMGSLFKAFQDNGFNNAQAFTLLLKTLDKADW